MKFALLCCDSILLCDDVVLLVQTSLYMQRWHFSIFFDEILVGYARIHFFCSPLPIFKSLLKSLVCSVPSMHTSVLTLCTHIFAASTKKRQSLPSAKTRNISKGRGYSNECLFLVQHLLGYSSAFCKMKSNDLVNSS